MIDAACGNAPAIRPKQDEPDYLPGLIRRLDQHRRSAKRDGRTQLADDLTLAVRSLHAFRLLWETLTFDRSGQ
jgi:hypothetical protein